MNYQNLYSESKIKKNQQQLLEMQMQERIRTMSSSKKINHNSNIILINKLNEQLASFQDEDIVNIETSIRILHTTKILQVIESIQAAKERLNRGQFENARLKQEAKFVYCLWKMIDEEEIETRQLKEIIYILHDKNVANLKKSLAETYSDQQSVNDFVESWKKLQQDNQYYKSMEKTDKKEITKIQQKELEKLISLQLALKQTPFNAENQQIRQLFLNLNQSKLKHKFGNDCNFMTMTSLNYSQKNKQNTYLDKSKEQALVNRLYQIDKYKIRQVQKKVDQQQRHKRQLQQCTFKPELVKERVRSSSCRKRSTSINGYEKAVNRMKIGVEKTRIEKQKRDYKPIGQNYHKIRDQKINPPKFLERKKQQQVVLFIIQFDLGKNKVKVKIHQYDSEESIANNLCKIYGLKQEYFDQICQIVRKERQIYEAQRQQ